MLNDEEVRNVTNFCVLGEVKGVDGWVGESHFNVIMDDLIPYRYRSVCYSACVSVSVCCQAGWDAGVS